VPWDHRQCQSSSAAVDVSQLIPSRLIARWLMRLVAASGCVAPHGEGRRETHILVPRS
jgi:hypothetical protein